MDIMNIYKESIAEYISKRNTSCSYDSVINYVLNQTNFDEVIRIAVRSRDHLGKMHSHQRRVPREAFDGFIKALFDIKDKIRNSNDFDRLFLLIQTEGNRIYGVGEMLIYDTAFRIGQWLKIFPKKIYLHRGARVGVERFMGRRIYREYILKDELKQPFNNCPLECWQLEDFFCIYKDIFEKNGMQIKSKQNWC